MSSICSQLEIPSVVSVHIQSIRARSSSRNGAARKLTSQPHQTTAFQPLSFYCHTRRKVLERVQLPANTKFGGICRQHLTTLATPTIRSIKCKQSPVYGVFWPLLPHPSTDYNETWTWSSLPPRNLTIKFGTNPSTIILVIVVTDRHIDTQTKADRNILPRFRGVNYTDLSQSQFVMSYGDEI